MTTLNQCTHAEPHTGRDGRVAIARFAECRCGGPAWIVSGATTGSDPPIKIMQPEKSELPMVPRPPVSSGMERSAPMVRG